MKISHNYYITDHRPFANTHRHANLYEKISMLHHSQHLFFLAAAAAKPYQSAYNRDQAADSKKYYCEICDKTLNGPKPYSSHMNSKAHREEEEYAKSMGRC